MNRSVPLWLVLFLGLCGLLFTVLVAWSVRSTLSGSDRSGALGRLAVEVAGFPTLSRGVMEETVDLATGAFQDKEFLVPREIDPAAEGFRELTGADGIAVRGVHLRAEAGAAPGWRFLSGTFALGDEVAHAALLISPGYEIVHVWRLADRPVEGEELKRPPHRIFPHGIELLPDGSVIYTFDGNDTLQRIDACGTPLWIAGGGFHHAVTLAEDGRSVWSLLKQGVTEVAVEDGRILRHLPMDEIAKKNPDIDIFGARRDERIERSPNERNQPTEPLADPVHSNDVDPLPARLAAAFPMFEPGDLAVSARSLNMIFVVDPDTAEVKWWRAGAVRRQHDPDWLETGEILIYDNRMGLDTSRIVAIDPATYAVRTVLDGTEIGFFSRVRGKQQPRTDGTLVVTSPQQGYAFETGNDGSVVLEIVNAKPGSTDENYLVSELRWYSPDTFNPGDWKCAPTD